MSDSWTERLSDYLDGTLAAGERRALETHLEGCPECTRTIEDLRRVVARSRVLGPPVIEGDLWPGIADRIRQADAPSRVTTLEPRAMAAWFARRFSFTIPQLAAASIALMLVSGGVVWWTLHRAPVSRRQPAGVPPSIQATSRPPSALATVPGRTRPAGDDAVTLAPVNNPEYDATIAELERILAHGRGRLDSTTVRILEQNLAIIDRATEEARRAVAADPANAYLRQHLAQQMRTKAELLRRVNLLASAQG